MRVPASIFQKHEDKTRQEKETAVTEFGELHGVSGLVCLLYISQ